MATCASVASRVRMTRAGAGGPCASGNSFGVPSDERAAAATGAYTPAGGGGADGGVSVVDETDASGAGAT